ncbi:MAG TPA: zinc-ribbon domain-containing protein [Geobacteraceae bacterium]
MEFECPNCKLAGKIPDDKIPLNGIDVTCPKCKSRFLLKLPERSVMPPTTESLFCRSCKGNQEIHELQIRGYDIKVCNSCNSFLAGNFDKLQTLSIFKLSYEKVKLLEDLKKSGIIVPKEIMSKIKKTHSRTVAKVSSQETSTSNAIVGFIVLLVIGWLLYSIVPHRHVQSESGTQKVSVNPDEIMRKAETEVKKENQQKMDLMMVQVRKYLRDNLKDPDSLKDLEVTGSGGHSITCRYRAKNSLGAYDVSNTIFFFDTNNQLARVHDVGQ